MNLPPPPTDLPTITSQEASLVFPAFTSDTAFALGLLLRQNLAVFPQPAVINISLANSQQLLFHTVTHPGTTPDNDTWVQRKRNSVLRFGCSTWFLHCKFAGDEGAFAAKYALQENAKNYAIHGGGFPVKVRGVEGVVAVIVVSGLKQEQDHGIIVHTIKEYLDGMDETGAEKKKED
ncbi:hypothetical protein LTR66_006683 [Elasticomyces elasticus]|nr:hypothetical protein LTR66_006683 [Elasticomyces elasticus]